MFVHFTALTLVIRLKNEFFSLHIIRFWKKAENERKICYLLFWQDELLWGAAWLQKATKNLKYLNYIQINGQILGAAEYDNTFGWDNKHAGARILLTKVKF